MFRSIPLLPRRTITQSQTPEGNLPVSSHHHCAGRVDSQVSGMETNVSLTREEG